LKRISKIIIFFLDKIPKRDYNIYMTILNSKIKIPIIAIGIIAAVSLFLYIQVTTDAAIDSLIDSIEKDKDCDCDRDC
jgi:hypothetical protein